MPKLSSYVQQLKARADLEDDFAALQLSGSSGSSAADARPVAPPSGGGSSSFGTSSTSSGGAAQRLVATPSAHPITAEPVDAISGAAVQPAAVVLSPQLQAAATKLREEYEKRLREHGPRLFRHPDGSLQPEQPPPDPFAVANRKRWGRLVNHCRTHGGDRAFEQGGISLRYGIGVTPEAHAAYLAAAGLRPETDSASGEPRGYIPSLPSDPLQDPQHCFNTFYSKQAESVLLGRARGRLL